MLERILIRIDQTQPAPDERLKIACLLALVDCAAVRHLDGEIHAQHLVDLQDKHFGETLPPAGAPCQYDSLGASATDIIRCSSSSLWGGAIFKVDRDRCSCLCTSAKHISSLSCRSFVLVFDLFVSWLRLRCRNCCFTAFTLLSNFYVVKELGGIRRLLSGLFS
jgi:hypothetical protein